VHATLTTTRGSNEDMASLAVMTGEAMRPWLRDIEGFLGLTLLTNQATGTTHVILFWESEEVAQRHRVARMKLRERITSTLNIEVQETESYDVSYADVPALRAPLDPNE
jgi:heme-degrading monooxygenase HmoA